MNRARIELFTAMAFAAAAIATMLWPSWIELLTHADPDGGSGGLEWWLVAVLAAMAVLSLVLSVRDHLIGLRVRPSDEA